MTCTACHAIDDWGREEPPHPHLAVADEIQHRDGVDTEYECRICDDRYWKLEKSGADEPVFYWVAL